MLKIEVPATELYDEEKNEFVYTKATALQLEHSLVSLSKWEAKWHKHFIGRTDISVEEFLDYVRCMTITQNVDENVYRCMTADVIRQIREYIEDPMTATILPKETGPKDGRFISSELIYYWLSCYNLPFGECQKWHLNRVLTLINVCSNESSEKKKMPLNDIYAQNRLLNEQRKAKLKTRG